MAHYTTWLVGAILIAHNFATIMTAAMPENETPETQQVSRHYYYGLKLFSTDFYQKVNGDTDNLICSPMSVGVVLALASFGARGNTEKQMKSALRLTDKNFGSYSYRTLIDTLTDVRTTEVILANKIFLADGVKLKSNFKDVAENDFKSAVETVDFSKGAEAAGTINSWCAEKTKNHIKEIVNAGDVQDSTMVMVNALYFKGYWMSWFDPKMTQPKPFHVDEKTTKDVDTMYKQSHYNYGTLPEIDATYVGLRYLASKDSDSATMFIILPNTQDGLKKVEESIHTLDLRKMADNSYSTLINLWLPKFKIESTINVNDVLEKLGMTDMFLDQADFTGITDDPPLKVSKVIQKAFIEVNEDGSEAAAATAVVEEKSAAPALMTPPIDFKVDHPFAFIIHHYDTDNVLFQGHIKLPTN